MCKLSNFLEYKNKRERDRGGRERERERKRERDGEKGRRGRKEGRQATLNTYGVTESPSGLKL